MYNPANWFWIGKPDGRSDDVIYASARGALVAADDATYVAWVDAGGAATPWPPNETGAITAAALDAVLTVAGLPATGLAVLTKDDLKAYAADKRWTVETGGITISGAQIDTSRDSQDMINKTFVSMQNFGLTSVNFKAASGWVSIDATTMTVIAKAVALHVQACFDAEHALDAEIDAGTVTTTAQIDAFAWPSA